MGGRNVEDKVDMIAAIEQFDNAQELYRKFIKESEQNTIQECLSAIVLFSADILCHVSENLPFAVEENGVCSELDKIEDILDLICRNTKAQIKFFNKASKASEVLH
jgi:hypothetical protein